MAAFFFFRDEGAELTAVLAPVAAVLDLPELDDFKVLDVLLGLASVPALVTGTGCAVEESGRLLVEGSDHSFMDGAAVGVCLAGAGAVYCVVTRGGDM